jgi:hypothetical protein
MATKGHPDVEEIGSQVADPTLGYSIHKDQGYYIWTLIRTITITNYNIKYKYIYVICFELRQRVLFKNELKVFYINI